MARTVISEGIALGVLVSAATLLPLVEIVDLKPKPDNILSVDYAKTIRIQETLPFRLRITNIGIEGYRENNPPGIGIQVIGFSNYIL